MFSHVDRTNATDRMRNLLPEPLERVRVFISPSAQKERAVDGARIFVTYYYYYYYYYYYFYIVSVVQYSVRTEYV